MKFFLRKIYKLNYIYNKIFKEKFYKKLNYDWSKTSKRYEIINSIIKNQKFKKYLEIGCFKDENFNRIEVEHKVGVDPISGGTVRATSDNYFKNNQTKFDLIFIDGLHDYHQVRKDILNSLKFIDDNGVILLHDCIPLKLRDQMMPRSHEYWNGDTWKAIVEARTYEHIDTYTILADSGLGLIFKRKNKNKLFIEKKNFKLLTFEEYFNNFKKFMNPVEEKDLFELFNNNLF